ncbi:MAG: hypothetical protein QXU20_03535 [Candidatus Woesearchaeota archaeon]
MKEHNLKILKLLFVLMGIFAIIFLIAFFDQKRGIKIFDIGFGFENYLVMVLSVASIFRIVFEIYRLENS